MEFLTFKCHLKFSKFNLENISQIFIILKCGRGMVNRTQWRDNGLLGGRNIQWSEDLQNRRLMRDRYIENQVHKIYNNNMKIKWI